MSKRKSRLERKNESRNIHRAVLFALLTIILGLAIVFLGIPALIRLALFIGDLRSSSIPIESQDTLAPPPPQLKPVSEATNSAQIDIEGFSESGATIEIFLNEISSKKIIAGADGFFLFSSFKLDKGENEIYAAATDEAGNQSKESEKLIITYDDQPPELIIDEPMDESRFSTDETKIEIKGKVEEKATITINNHFIIVDAEGNFSYLVNLEEGENKIEIVATDKAGNETKKEITVKRE